jgi:hypothetical protein
MTHEESEREEIYASVFIPSVHGHDTPTAAPKPIPVLYSVTDSPTLEKCGLRWEERKTTSDEIVRLGNVIPA